MMGIVLRTPIEIAGNIAPTTGYTGFRWAFDHISSDTDGLIAVRRVGGTANVGSDIVHIFLKAGEKYCVNAIEVFPNGVEGTTLAGTAKIILS